MKKIQACPICPDCGSRKFERIKGKEVKVRCLSCSKVLVI